MSNTISYLQGECDPAFGAEFVFTVHAKELIVGEVFVRVYNEQPTFPLEVRDTLYSFTGESRHTCVS